MRVIIASVFGAVLGFAAMLLAIGAVVLFLAGVGGGILVRERPESARVLNYDPSNVVLRAAVTGVAALVLMIVYVVVLRRMPRTPRR